MSTLTQATIDFAAPAAVTTPHDQIGFELGWDFAHHRLVPPAPYAQEMSPLRHGLLAGQATFGARTLPASRPVRKWLQLRLHAWLRGLSVELFQVTPHYLQQIDARHCPITRVPLFCDDQDVGDGTVERVRHDAGYAAGNLAVMSAKAHHAKASHGFDAATKFALQIEMAQSGGEAQPAAPGGIGGLTAAQWRRVAVLCSFVEPRDHLAACAIPLLVLPPNRLRLFNPVQALQAFVSKQFLKAGWSQRVSRFEDLLPGKALQRDFKQFFMALVPRVLEAGHQADAQHTRWAVEDAWQHPLVQQRWLAFASQLTAGQCEALVRKATLRKLGTGHVEHASDAQATEGWNLATRGYVPHPRAVRPVPPLQLPLPV